jgi:hypothetical protein
MNRQSRREFLKNGDLSRRDGLGLYSNSLDKAWCGGYFCDGKSLSKLKLLRCLSNACPIH